MKGLVAKNINKKYANERTRDAKQNKECKTNKLAKKAKIQSKKSNKKKIINGVTNGIDCRSKKDKRNTPKVFDFV